MHDNIKRLHLQRAVSGIDELRQVKNQADQTKAITGKKLTFRQYCKLLQSAAAQYDVRFKPKRHDSHRPARRSVYTHDFAPANEFDKDDDIYFERGRVWLYSWMLTLLIQSVEWGWKPVRDLDLQSRAIEEKRAPLYRY